MIIGSGSGIALLGMGAGSLAPGCAPPELIEKRRDGVAEPLQIV